MLLYKKARLLLTVLGAAASATLALAQLAIYCGMMSDATAIIRNSGADIWVASKNIQNIALLGEQLRKYRILSPISGKVMRKYVQEGEILFVMTPVPLLNIVDLDGCWINAEIDETDVGKVQIGASVEIHSAAFAERTFSGKVAQIADFAGDRSFIPNNQARILDMKTVQIKIEFVEPAPLKLGMTVDVRIAAAKEHSDSAGAVAQASAGG